MSVLKFSDEKFSKFLLINLYNSYVLFLNVLTEDAKE